MRLIVFEKVNKVINADDIKCIELVNDSDPYCHSGGWYFSFKSGNSGVYVDDGWYTLDAIRKAITNVEPFKPLSVEQR